MQTSQNGVVALSPARTGGFTPLRTCMMVQNGPQLLVNTCVAGGASPRAHEGKRSNGYRGFLILLLFWLSFLASHSWSLPTTALLAT